MSEAVNLEVTVKAGQVVLTLRTDRATPIPITVEPQAAFELGEQMARAAHEAREGKPPPSDESYLRDQIKRRTTEDYRNMLVRKVEIILNSMREDKKWSNRKMSEELTDIVLSRVLPS